MDFTGQATRTKQSFKDECDINCILSKYQRTGVIEHVRKHGAFYGDVPAVDYQDAQNTLIRANNMFEELPSSVRKRFNHDPAQFLRFVQDPDNQDEAVILGLVNPPSPPPPGEDSDPGDTPT